MADDPSAAHRAVKPVPILAAAVVALATIGWGGGTSPGAQAAALAAIGALLALAPAPQWPRRTFGWLALAWMACACAAFLPANWFAAPEWRAPVIRAGIALPPTLSPQPWLSLEALAWLAAGLAWIGWLSARPLDDAARRLVARTLAGGIACVALAAVIAWELHRRIPGWLSERGFGPFPNRNHTGHVLALGGVLALGCAADAARRKISRALPWIAAAAIICGALVLNFSRGGVLLFLGAGALWAAIAAWQKRSWKVAALGGAALLAAAALALLSSDALAARFAGGRDSQIGFRTLIWRDTLAMVSAAPWCGNGLGNFRALFPFFRHASVIQQAVWHPESDWLWLAAENGWPAVALAAAALATLLRDALPLARGTQRRLRTAALGGAVCAAGHALIDVPLHRPGSALLALLVLALARKETPPAPAAAAPWMWRALGAALLAAAAWRFAAPDELARADVFVAEGRLREAASAASRAIARAPLDWQGYYARATVAANEGRVLSALEDFRRARLLEPHHASVPLEEGRVWVRIVPALALPAWEDALRRVSPPHDSEIFGAMLDAAPNDAAFRAALLDLAKERPALRAQWNRFVPPAEREDAR